MVNITEADLTLDEKNTVIKVNGGATAWIINLVQSVFKKELLNLLIEEISSELQSKVDQVLNEEIAKYMDIIELSQTLDIDLSLMQNPNFIQETKSAYFNLDFNGTLFETADSLEGSAEEHDFPWIYDIMFGITTETVNSILHKAGTINLSELYTKFTGDQLTSESISAHDSIQDFFPNLWRHYLNSDPLNISVSFAQDDFAKISNDEIYMELSPTFKVHRIEGDQELLLDYTLNNLVVNFTIFTNPSDFSISGGVNRLRFQDGTVNTPTWLLASDRDVGSASGSFNYMKNMYISEFNNGSLKFNKLPLGLFSEETQVKLVDGGAYVGIRLDEALAPKW